MKFAIIETGGKQYKVSLDQKVRIEKLVAKAGEKVVFDKVLLMTDGEKIDIGTPYLSGVSVEADLLREGREKKKLVFRYHSKTRYRRKKGHRQQFSEVQIKKI